MAKLNKAVVDIQKRNAFDLSFINSLTGKVGTLVPCLCKKVIPGDVISDKVSFQVELPPLASSFRGKIDFRIEAFFVPNRLLYGGWQDYMMYNGGLSDQYRPEGVDTCYLPYFTQAAGNTAGTLLDYLGFSGFTSDGSVAHKASISALPFLAYHKIYDDWYRDGSVQKPVFRPRSVSDSAVFGYHLPFMRLTNDNALNAQSGFPTGSNPMLLYDGKSLLSLRQRNYSKDFFTTAFTSVNGGSNPVEVDTAGDSFTIAQFRAANALQRFAERNQLARGDYKRSIFVNYGVTPSDSVCNRSIYLGSCKAPIITKDIFVTAENAGEDVSNNGFLSLVGGKTANASAAVNGTLFKNFKVTEHGYILVLCSLVPQAAYASRNDESLLKVGKFSDSFVVPALAQVGNQVINRSSLNGLASSASSTAFDEVFGYTERYAEYKTSVNEVHGLFRPSETLNYMAVRRLLDGVVEMSSNFLEIKTSDLDNITAVGGDLSLYGFMADIYHDLKAIRPLPKYSIPTLCDHILDSKWVEIDKSFNL